MKIKICCSLFVLTLFIANIESLSAQSLELPRKSPKATISYTVGLTEIAIAYSSPALNDRELWGSLVPYDKVWRAGANEATTIEFSTDINIEGENLKAGKYSFFIIPKESGEWTCIFNEQHKQWGSSQYDKAKDVARIYIKPNMVNVNQERLNYDIVDQSMEQGYIRLSWGKARLYLRFKVDVVEAGMENVDQALEVAKEEQKWIIYAEGANFLLDLDKHINQAMEWAEASTELHNSSWNWWVKARILAKKELYKEAISAGKKALEFGMDDEKDQFFKANADQIRSTMRSWTEKA